MQIYTNTVFLQHNFQIRITPIIGRLKTLTMAPPETHQPRKPIPLAAWNDEKGAFWEPCGTKSAAPAMNFLLTGGAFKNLS